MSRPKGHLSAKRCRASREHLQRARERRDEYYLKKYAGWNNWISIRWQSVWLWVDRNLLGYGEHIGRAVVGSAILLLLISVAQFLYVLDPGKPFGEAVWQLFTCVQYVLFLLLDLPDTKAQPPLLLAVIVVTLRYFLIGLLVAALFRKLSHR